MQSYNSLLYEMAATDQTLNQVLQLVSYLSGGVASLDRSVVTMRRHSHVAPMPTPLRRCNWCTLCQSIASEKKKRFARALQKITTLWTLSGMCVQGEAVRQAGLFLSSVFWF